MEEFYYNLGYPMPTITPDQNKMIRGSDDPWAKRGLLIPAPLLDLSDRQEIVQKAFSDVDFWDSMGGKEVYDAFFERVVEDVQENPMLIFAAMELEIHDDDKDLVVPNEDDTYGQLIRSPEDVVEDKGFRKNFALRYFTPTGELKARQDYINSLLDVGQAVKSDEDGRVWVYPMTRWGRGDGVGEAPLATPETLITRLILKTLAKLETEDERWGPGFTGYEYVNEVICDVQSADEEAQESSIIRKVGGAISGVNNISMFAKLKGTVKPPAIYMNSTEVDRGPYVLGPRRRVAESVI